MGTPDLDLDPVARADIRLKTSHQISIAYSVSIETARRYKDFVRETDLAASNWLKGRDELALHFERAASSAYAEIPREDRWRR